MDRSTENCRHIQHLQRIVVEAHLKRHLRSGAGSHIGMKFAAAHGAQEFTGGRGFRF